MLIHINSRWIYSPTVHKIIQCHKHIKFLVDLTDLDERINCQRQCWYTSFEVILPVTIISHRRCLWQYQWQYFKNIVIRLLTTILKTYVYDKCFFGVNKAVYSWKMLAPVWIPKDQVGGHARIYRINWHLLIDQFMGYFYEC